MDAQTLLVGGAQPQMEMEIEREEIKLDREADRNDGVKICEEIGRGEGKEGESDANETGLEDGGKIVEGTVGGYNQEMPPADDVCPICFDRFTIPCRSNCGHWFCASCILQFWMFRSSIQPCKCPLCCCRIVNLRPETSELIQPAHDIDEVLKKVNQYNGLFITGVLGTFHRMQALPLFIGRFFRVLIDPDGLRCVYYIMRLLGLFLAILYERWEFEFMPTGGMGIQRMFDMGASVMVVVLFLIGIGYRWFLRGRAGRVGGEAIVALWGQHEHRLLYD